MATDVVHPEFSTVQEAADRLRVTRMTIYNLIKAGELPTIHVGRAVRIRNIDIEHYIERHSSQSRREKRPRQRATAKTRRRAS